MTWSVICPISCGKLYSVILVRRLMRMIMREYMCMIMRCGVGWWQRNYASRAQKTVQPEAVTW